MKVIIAQYLKNYNMQTHTDLLNVIAIKIKAQTYLEIGVYHPDHNFNKVSVLNKISVDPDPKAGALVHCTSDAFFKLFPNSKFDLIFIDGLHHADQVKKDLLNAWEQLNEGGVIVMHDCNPPSELTTCVPRGSQREWCGDVYKTAGQIESPKFTVDFDYGCTVLRKEPGTENPLIIGPEWLPDGASVWEIFNANRKELLNLISTEEAKEIIAAW